jgi:hypothetical protein
MEKPTMELYDDTISILNKIDEWIAEKGSAVLSTPTPDLDFIIFPNGDNYEINMSLPDPNGTLTGEAIRRHLVVEVINNMYNRFSLYMAV